MERYRNPRRSRRTLACRRRASNPLHLMHVSEHTITIRVRYPECDPMGYLHHSIFLQYFEIGRVELLRSLGHNYSELEREGLFFVVVKAAVQYKSPARYDDQL